MAAMPGDCSEDNPLLLGIPTWASSASSDLRIQTILVLQALLPKKPVATLPHQALCPTVTSPTPSDSPWWDP